MGWGGWVTIRMSWYIFFRKIYFVLGYNKNVLVHIFKKNIFCGGASIPDSRLYYHKSMF